MADLFNRRRPTHRRPAEPARPVLRLPVAEPADERQHEAQRQKDEDEPERGVAVIDFYI